MTLHAPLSDAPTPIFTLAVGREPEPLLDVVSFAGVEELSAPYRFDVVVTTRPDAPALECAALLGAYARLTLATPGGGARGIHGVISVARQLGPVRDAATAQYRLRVVPRLALLRHTQNSRIYQDQTVPEIVRAVLGGAGLAQRWQLLGAYATRPYCVQHQESDLAFVARLLAEEGIWYRFEHPDGDPDTDAEVAVFCDRETHYAPIAGDPELALARADSGAEGERVTRFARGERVRPGAVQQRYYDPRRPSAPVRASAAVASPGGGFDASTLAVYDHHAEYDDAAPGRGDARRALDQHRRAARRAAGESDCRRLAPGATFALVDPGVASIEGEFVVTRVEHRGRPRRADTAGVDDAVYGNRFECVPREVNAMPPRPARRIQQGLETATVVGPAGEEIWVDALGRIKVQFHWDRIGAHNEHSSCWLRVVQPWAGAHFGAQFVPRVGAEVVVGFLGGDTDRPVVLGGVFNGENGVPFDLPSQKTRGGFRTASSPGGDGHNELSFEDAAGREEVLLRAQRDLREVVLHDRRTEIGADLDVTVGGDSVESVAGERIEVVRGGRSSTVMGALSSHVLGDARAVVDGDRVEVNNARVEHVVADRLSTRVGGVDERVVAGAASTTVRGDHNVRVHGCATMQVGRHDRMTSYALHVEGAVDATGTQVVTVSSDHEVVLRCGRSLLRLTPEQIELVAPTVRVTAEGAAAVLGDDRARVSATRDVSASADKVVLRAAGASLGLDHEARLDGAMVHLGAGDSTDALDAAAPPPPTRIELVDQDGAPLANQRYKLWMPDGSTRAGVLDRQGVAVLDLTGPAEITFEEVAEVEPT